MDQSRLSSVVAAVSKPTKGGTAALAVVISALVAMFLIAIRYNQAMAWVLLGLFSIGALGVFHRYITHGPERDRGQAFFSSDPNSLRFGNADMAYLDNPIIQRLLVNAVENRSPLPEPAGIVEGNGANRRILELPVDELHSALPVEPNGPLLSGESAH
jgi:hypothetical protein